MAIEYLSLPEYAKTKDLTGQYIGQLIRKGVITKKSVKKKGKRLFVNPELADLDMERNLSPENRKVKTETEIEKEKVIADSGIDDDSTAEGGTYSDMRLLNEKYKAALKKLDYEQKSLQLIDADEVKREADFAGRLVKQKVSSWPGRVSALVAAESDPFKCEQILKKECNELLEEISGGL
jgi:hypothetical protein